MSDKGRESPEGDMVNIYVVTGTRGMDLGVPGPRGGYAEHFSKGTLIPESYLGTVMSIARLQQLGLVSFVREVPAEEVADAIAGSEPADGELAAAEALALTALDDIPGELDPNELVGWVKGANVPQVLAYVTVHPESLLAVIELEKRGKARKTLLPSLNALLEA